MLPILPREFLWSELVSMDEFFHVDTINEDIYEVFLTLREAPFNIQADAVRVFNEVYYQVTRMCFEYPLPTDLDKYIADIKANLGWNYSAELVMSVTYQLITHINKTERPFNKFFTKSIYDKYNTCRFWKPFKRLFVSLKKKNRTIDYSFTPHPIPIADLGEFYFNWAEITHNYNLSCIEHVINLWDYRDEKMMAAELILESLNSNPLLKKKRTDIIQIKRFLDTYMVDVEDQMHMVAEYTESLYEGQIEKLQKDKERLENKVKSLETEVEILKSQLVKNKRKKVGAERVFTLGLIVDYCKKKCSWEEVKDTVAMLNKLIRNDATQEDFDLIDSIEEEYKQRAYGCTYNGPVGQVVQHVDRLENKS